MGITFRLNKPFYFRDDIALTPLGYNIYAPLKEWLYDRNYVFRAWDQKFENGDGHIYIGCYLGFGIKREAIMFLLSWQHALSDTFYMETML